MIDYTELIARLREGQTYVFNTGESRNMGWVMDEAADALEAHASEIERLKAACDKFSESELLQQAQPERAPLDMEEITTVAREQHGDVAEECGFRSGVRWAEKRHGIKQGGQHD